MSLCDVCCSFGLYCHPSLFHLSCCLCHNCNESAILFGICPRRMHPYACSITMIGSIAPDVCLSCSAFLFVFLVIFRLPAVLQASWLCHVHLLLTSYMSLMVSQQIIGLEVRRAHVRQVGCTCCIFPCA